MSTQLLVAGFTQAVLDLQPLLEVYAPPARIAGSWMTDDVRVELTPDRWEVLARICSHLGLPLPTYCLDCLPKDMSVFERIVNNRLAKIGRRFGKTPVLSTDIDQFIQSACIAGIAGRRSQVARSNGSQLRAYSAGQPHNPAIIIVAACGMPAQLCERWLNVLGEDYFVVTWETWGLFTPLVDVDSFDLEWSSQVRDLFAVMDHFGIRQAHLMGLCGGANIALAAAAAESRRVTSLSLWHGDYELGGDCPTTPHQRHFKELMKMAAENRSIATDARDILLQNIHLTTVAHERAQWTLYPYANSELMYRYSRINGSIMSFEAGDAADQVTQPALVVTSDDDSTAHPAGSRKIASRLRNATLHVLPHGDHLSLFEAVPEVTNLAREFLRFRVE